MIDLHFRINLIEATSKPQKSVYAAMHQDYSEEYVFDEMELFSEESESWYGEKIVKHLLAGNRGHFGPFEHPQITLNCGWFPHSTMQQLRTHRVGISFDVSSFRYTGQRIIDIVEGKRELEEVFYLRPVGFYSDRQGKKYEYTSEIRKQDLDWCFHAAMLYRHRISQGFSEEQARGIIPFDIRQHWVMSMNARSLMHLLDLRWKPDAQLECQQFCDLLFPHFQVWMPEVATWYLEKRAKKALLAP